MSAASTSWCFRNPDELTTSHLRNATTQVLEAKPIAKDGRSNAACVQPFKQCGGEGWSGPEKCCPSNGGFHCTHKNETYSRCEPAHGSADHRSTRAVAAGLDSSSPSFPRIHNANRETTLLHGVRRARRPLVVIWQADGGMPSHNVDFMYKPVMDTIVRGFSDLPASVRSALGDLGGLPQVIHGAGVRSRHWRSGPAADLRAGDVFVWMNISHGKPFWATKKIFNFRPKNKDISNFLSYRVRSFRVRP